MIRHDKGTDFQMEEPLQAERTIFIITKENEADNKRVSGRRTS